MLLFLQNCCIDRLCLKEKLKKSRNHLLPYMSYLNLYDVYGNYHAWEWKIF
jgi:hypothetical protein